MTAPAIGAKIEGVSSLSDLLARPEVERTRQAARETRAAMTPEQRGAHDADWGQQDALRAVVADEQRPDPERRRALGALRRLDVRVARRKRHVRAHVARSRVVNIVSQKFRPRARERTGRRARAARSRSPDDGGDGSGPSRRRGDEGRPS